jgi:hypothetical protein
MMLWAFWLLLVMCMPKFGAGQQTWYVWTNSPTHGPGTAWSNAFHDIQTAIDIAGAGDTILVTNGTYMLASEIYCGIGITIRSVNGYEDTIIDGDGKTRCLWTGFSANTVIDGFTFQNGVSPDYGGGIYVRDGLVTNCLIRKCFAPTGGGGIYSKNGIVADCTITSNRSASGGAGIYCSSGVIKGCTVSSNASGSAVSIGADSVVLDCTVERNQGASGVYGVAGSSILNSVIAYNVSSGSGGGISTSGFVSNCIVRANRSSSDGGGVTDGNTAGHGVFVACTICSNTSSTSGGGVKLSRGGVLLNCLITDNMATNDGGGVYTYNDGGLISNCVISGNSCHGNAYGGGVSTARATLLACVITSNTAKRGGGVYSCARISDSEIHHNRASIQGGGVLLASADGVIDGCKVYGNTSGNGGGVYADINATVQGCLVTGNSATNQGGGLWSMGSILSCTIVSNLASNSGGGIYNYYDATVANSVLALNSASSGPNHYGYGQFSYCRADPMPPGVSNTISDPLFIDEEHGNYRLQQASPCVDSGTNMSWMATATDLDGKSRILNGEVDMGAYETIPHLVDTDTDGMPDWWEWEYSHSMTGITTVLDMDTDGFSNVQEYLADTDPSNSNSLLQVTGITHSHGGVCVSWKGGVWSKQYVEMRSGLSSTGEIWQATYTNQPPTVSETNIVIPDTTNQTLFYRIRVER